MLLPESSVSAVEDEAPADLEEVCVYATSREGFDYGLVVLTMGLPYWLVPTSEGHRLLVEGGALPRVREQLAKFERESAGWPPPPIVDVTKHETDLITPLLWAATVLAIYQLQATRPEWTELGALDATAIFGRGESWRVITALFLHADGAHVISNALSGLLLFTAVLKTFGRTFGWLWIGCAAVVANTAVAAFAYPSAYRSLGASTAIFAGLGLLIGRMLRVLARSDHPQRRRSMFVTLGSGLVVFALYGAGGGAAHVDLGAHLAGFVAGLAVGFIAAAGRDTTGAPREVMPSFHRARSGAGAEQH